MKQKQTIFVVLIIRLGETYIKKRLLSLKTCLKR